MSRVEFEYTIPVFERSKTALALDRAATVIIFIIIEILEYHYYVCAQRIYRNAELGNWPRIFLMRPDEK
jgi:hypothetical protein